MSEIFRFENSSVDGLVDFAGLFPWEPAFPEPLIRRFFAELISSPDLILDLHDSIGRWAVAVLLDRIDNPANDVCLEILGARPDAIPSQVLERAIDWAKSRVPKHRAGFQLSLPPTPTLSETRLQELDLHFSYETFSMSRPTLHDLPTANPESLKKISAAAPRDAVVVYHLLREAFAENVDTSIPDLESWKDGFLRSPKSHFHLWRDQEEILGFLNLIEDEKGEGAEIRTLGVKTSARGQGIGGELLVHALHEAQKRSLKSCELSVAVTNQRALGLYQRAGFKVDGRFSCFRWSAKISPLDLSRLNQYAQISLGLERSGQVRLLPHRDEWASAFESEATLLANALDLPMSAFHHVGSTAVPGIVAKPILDILGEVDDLQHLDRRLREWESLGYEVKGEYGIAGRCYAVLYDVDQKKSFVHVHLYPKDHPEVARHLHFRDVLRHDRQSAREYEQHKIHLVDDLKTPRSQYSEAKNDVIARIMLRRR